MSRYTDYMQSMKDKLGYERETIKSVYIPTPEEKAQINKQNMGLGGAGNALSGGILGTGALYGQIKNEKENERYNYLANLDTDSERWWVMSAEDAIKEMEDLEYDLDFSMGLYSAEDQERMKARYAGLQSLYGDNSKAAREAWKTRSADLDEAVEFQKGLRQNERIQGWQNKYTGMSYYDLNKAIGKVTDPAEKAWLQQYAPTVMTDADYGWEIGELNTQEYTMNKTVEELRQRQTELQQQITGYSRSFTVSPQQRQAAQDELNQVTQQLNEAQAQYEDLMRRKWQLEHDREYRSIPQNEDFELMSQFTNSGVGADFRGVNQKQDARDVIAGILGVFPALYNTQYERMTEEEVKTFNYLYQTRGKDAAEEYIDYLKPQLDSRRTDEFTQSLTDFTGRNAGTAFLGNVASVPLNLLSGIGALDVGSQHLMQDITGEYRPINYNNPGMMLSKGTKAIRGTTADMITDATGTIQLDEKKHPVLSTILNGRGLADVYQLGMSAVDSRVAALTGDPVTATILLASSAATSGILDALERGATDEQALQMGMWNGAFEALFEFIEVDNLLKGDPNWVKAMTNQAIKEGVGEGLTSVANNVADGIIMADKSALMRAAAEYEAQGLSEREAYRKAFADMMVDIGWDIIGGAASGGLSAGGYSAVGAITSRMQYNALPQQIKTSTERLQGLGQDRSTALDASEKLFELGKQYEGQRDAFMAAYDPKQDVYRYASDFNTAWEIGRNNGNREYIGKLSLSESQGKIAYELGVAAAKAKSEAATVSPEEKESGYSVSEGGETVSAETGRKVTIRGFTSVGSDATLDIGGGKTIKAEDVSYADIDEAMLYETVAEVAGSTRNANNILEDYRKAAQSGMSASDYAAALRQTYDLGVSGQVAERQLGNYELAGKLGVGVRSIVFSKGADRGKYTEEERQAALREKGRQAKGNRQGTFHFERNGRTFSKTQEASLGALEGLSKALGVDIFIYESYEDGGKRVYQDRSGKVKSAPNGWYDTETGAIHIDLNAGNFGQGTMMFTAAHELTHFIKQWSPVKFRKLADLLVKRYAEQGVSVRDLIDNQIAKAEKNGRTIDRDTAFEEVVADSMETMLTQGDAASFMAEIRQQDKTLWEKVRDWFKNLSEKLRGVVDAYQGYTPDSPEGRIVAQMEDFIGVLQEAYSEALMDASENYRANDGKKNTTLEGGVRYSLPYGNAIDLLDSEELDRTSNTHLLVLEHTPSIYVDKADAKDLKIVMAWDVAYLAMKKDGPLLGHYHNLGKDVMKRIPSALNNPLYILKQNNGRIIAVSEVVVKKNRSVLVSIELDTFKSTVQDGENLSENYNLIVTVFDAKANYLNNLFENSDVKFNKNDEDPAHFILRLKSLNKALPNDGLAESSGIRLSQIDAGVNPEYAEKRSDRDPTAAATAQELEKQNAKLKQDVKDLRELLSLQGKLTKGTEFRKSSIEAAVKGLAQTAGATLDANGRTQLYDMLKGFYRYIASDENLAWDGVREEAGKIADFLQSNVKFKPQRSDYANDVLGYLRGQRVALSESQRAEVEKLYGYENYRKQLFGAGIYLSKDGISLDSLWHEAAGGDMFPGTFDMDIAEGNQPAELLRVIEGMREDDGSGALEYAYNRDFIRQDLIQAVYDSYWRVDNLHTVADRKQREINEIRRKHNERMDALTASHQETVKRLREERRADIQAVREAYRQRNARDLQKARERYAQARERGKESRAAASQRQIVEKAARDMMDMLRKPTKDAHVPMALQKPLEKLLNSIDFTSNRAAAGGEPTIRDVAYTRALQDVKLAIAAQRTALEGDGDGTFSLDVPKEFLDQIDAHIKMIQDATEGLDLTTNRVHEMSSDELRDLAYILKTINRAVRQIDKLHMEGAKARVSDLAKDTVWEMGRRTPVKTEEGGAAMWANYTPTFAFERMGSAATQILDGLKMGQAKLARTADAVIKFTGETYTNKEVTEWEKNVHEIKLESGKTVKMTTAQIMSFYCLSRREQAKGHLNGGGIRMGNIGEGWKAIRQTDHFRLTQEDIARINGLLTDRQMEVANKMQRYMADVGGKLGNEISMARWDYMEMTDKDYFPIRSDSDIHDAKNPDQDKANLWGLLNKGFTKALVKGANDAMIVSSIFDVFANHMSEMAEYNAFALPLVDAMKWYNYRETQKGEGDQIKTVGVKKALNDTLGTAAGEYFIDLMTDINSSQKAGRFENFFGKLLSRSKAASVGWNLRVAIQQPTAILRASVYLDPKNLLKGITKFGSKKLGEEMRKYSGIALWKSLGYYDLNISRGITDQIKGDTTLLDKMNDWGMWLPGKMDQWTWTSIWAGCKAQVQAEKKLTGEALLEETAKQFENLVYHTQVADSVLTRSSIMRSKSQTIKELTSFMAEPTMSANLLLSAFQDYREGVTKGEKAKRAMRIAFCGYVLSGLANALITAFADAFRDDDEYEGYWEKYFQALFGEKVYDGNLFAELNPLEKIVFVRDILSMLHGYEASKNPFMELVESSVGLLENVGKFIQGKGSLTAYGLIYQGLQVLGSFTGAAPANMLREVTTIWNNTFGKWNNMIIHRYETDPKQAIREAYKAGALGKREAQNALIEQGVAVTDAYWMVKEWDTGNTSKYTDLYTAALNGQDLTAHIRELTENGKTKKEVLSELKGQIGTWYTDPESDTRIDREEAKRMLEQYFDLNTNEIEDQLRLWDMKADTGFSLNDLKQKFLDEAVSADDAVRYLVEYGGNTQEDAQERVDEWAFELEHGYSYDDIRQTYQDGEITADEARDVMMEVAGKTQEQADYSLLLWDFEKENGWKYEDRASLYKDGKITRDQLSKALIDVGEYEKQDALYQVEVYDWEMEGLEGATIKRVQKWHEYCKGAGISKETFLDIQVFSANTKNDVDAEGKTINYSAMKKVMAEINRLPLSDAQKDALARSLGWSEKNIRKYKPW